MRPQHSAAWLIRLIIGILTALAVGGLAVEIGIKLGAPTLTLVILVALGLITQRLVIARAKAKRNAMSTKKEGARS